ncbi:hydroxyacyl-thioester dehydratase type 2, mitochondrial-like [Exaiptasia diaphana]|uniref:MaoC-like domain-containing protein n=1 Tax=Exaiptasia diaphana TaxID=2652724 RepID=A0A913XFA5_EXADI|nr:hydroxyacyl-thioester dehydratase type 2, mitochondrial-like [Exaiptasia diaphana]
MGKFSGLFCKRFISLLKSESNLKVGQYYCNRHCFTKKTFKVGEKAQILRVFKQSDVNTFAELTGDRNPIHTDNEFAGNGRFAGCVVHGVLVNGLISCLHGTILPGAGCLVVSQNIKFISPLFVGETVSAEVEVLSYRHYVMVCSAVCKAVNRNEVILIGETKLLLPKT